MSKTWNLGIYESQLDRTAAPHPAQSPSAPRSFQLQRYLVPLGRALYAAVFLVSLPNLFGQVGIRAAAQQGVPLPSVAVPLAGAIAASGALSVLVGYRAKLGAWLLVLFLAPVTVMMHNFWAVTDPMMAQFQEAMFVKNIGLLGTALLLACFGAGPVSVDARR